jgi:hypothetical protein
MLTTQGCKFRGPPRPSAPSSAIAGLPLHKVLRRPCSASEPLAFLHQFAAIFDPRCICLGKASPVRFCRFQMDPASCGPRGPVRCA